MLLHVVSYRLLVSLVLEVAGSLSLDYRLLFILGQVFHHAVLLLYPHRGRGVGAGEDEGTDALRMALIDVCQRQHTTP